NASLFLCRVDVILTICNGNRRVIRDGNLIDATARPSGPARAGSTIYINSGDNRTHRDVGAAVGRRELHRNAGAARTLCQSPSAARVLLLAAAPHEVTSRLVRRFNPGHLAREQLSAAGQHIQAWRGLEALPDAQVGCLGSPQLAGLAC